MMIGASKRQPRADEHRFSCGHPRSDGNVVMVGPSNGRKNAACRFCIRMAQYRYTVDRQIARALAGRPTVHQRILARFQ